MIESKTRDKILKRIRQAIIDKADLYGNGIDYRELSSYVPAFPELELAENFISLGGHFVYCEKQKELSCFLQELIDQLQPQSVVCSYPPLLPLLKHIQRQSGETGKIPDMSITFCPMLVASPPGMILHQTTPFIAARYPVFVATVSATVPNLITAFEQLKDSFCTGDKNRFEILHFNDFFHGKSDSQSPFAGCWLFLTEEEL